MESIEFTGEVLEKIFDDNFIEDNNLFDCLKGRKGTIEFKTNDWFDDDRIEGEPDESDNVAMTIKLKMVTE